MKPFFMILLALFCYSTSFAKKYKVASPEAFNKAAAAAVPGDEIIILNGHYTDWAITINTNGNAGKPIIIKAQTAGKVIFSGRITQSLFKLTGSYTVLSGLQFADCRIAKDKGSSGLLVDVKAAQFCRITGCTFTRDTADAQFMPLVSVSGKAADNRIDHCQFIGNVDNMEVQVQVRDVDVPVRTLIDQNVFRDKPKVSWKNANGGECVQIGQDPVLLGTRYAYTTVRDNRFINCNGEAEVISNKSSGNRYSNNYLENCAGELVMRGGHDCVIDSNTIQGGTGGIRVNGTHHTITNNKLTGLPTGIRLMYGMAKGKEEIGFYIAASDCIVSNNHIDHCKVGILVGDSKNADWTGKFDTKRYPSRVMQDVPPTNYQLADNVITDSQDTLVDNTR
ncbi:polysaccharide lyase 6 family protein [Paraflavitalea pollutisoli]|uniref:polysaccharide lyase 6 family protein n=1 Tax=Paraflavitalea pollutisoli TaxID=3034143 RepID=UPI0023ED716F|nr:polysaccharide lyase 6 family protein [Paraflavitalea sp. H1-2-19X]